MATFAVAIAATPLAHAEDAAGVPAGLNDDTAKEGFDKGVGMYKQGDYAGALAEFLSAYKAKPFYSLLYNIAQSHAMLDHDAQALYYYVKYLNEGADYIDADRRDLVLQEIERLEDILCQLTIDVTPDGAFVLVDGKLIGKSPIAEVQYLDPGEHEILVQAQGWITETRTLVLKREKPTTIAIVLEAATSPGKIVVQSKAEGSVVLIDGVKVGAAPWKGDLEAGMHVVSLKGPGEATAVEEVEIVEGETQKVVLDPVVGLDAGSFAGETVLPVKGEQKAKKKAKKIGPGPFAGAAGTAVAGGVVAVVLGVLGKKNHDAYVDFQEDVASGAFTGTDDEAIAKQKDISDRGHGLNGGFVASLTVAVAGAVAAAILAPFTDFGGKKKVEVQASGPGVLVTVSF